MDFVKKHNKIVTVIAIIVVLIGGYTFYQSRNVKHVIKNGVYKYNIEMNGDSQKVPGGMIFGDKDKFVSFDSDYTFKNELKSNDNLKSDLLRTTATYSATKDSITIKADDETMSFYDLKIDGKTISGSFKYGQQTLKVKMFRIEDVK
ncbi:hypothetical protein RD055328_01400 [Companilactobacillus sp. RD055328]|uniref:hypothetical protein n=1 Tax=Companilactobacillus sp. RD055328 TaxID=2916634 RepID=UPI001FC8402C|nr:hypothetical protein [Companilactobacillus sp. RD055328]GKQ42217.1 hypothetical protein RD055328_01400 [Companilactobacillus sp. RD055328]